MFGKHLTPAQMGSKIIRDTMWSLLDKEPFFAHIALGLKLEADEKVDTLSTNGTKLKYNPAMVMSRAKADPAEFEAIIAHEILHVAYMHPWRCGERDEKLWNVAADETTNAILRQHGFKVGKDWVNLGLAQGRTTEQIYEILKQGGGGGKNNKPDKFGMMEKPDPNGEPQEGEPGDEEGEGQGRMSAEDVEYEAKKGIMEAASLAKEAGKMPGDLVSIVKSLNESTRDWKDILRRILGEGDHVTQSWSRPNRRYVGDGEYLPGNIREGANTIFLVCDTSGSIDDNLLSKFEAEMNKIKNDISAECTVTISCDCRVQHTAEFGPYDDMKLVAKGRGGTDMAPAFQYIKDHGAKPRAVILFSDLEMSSFGEKPECPVLWICWPGGSTMDAPFGETLRMEA